MNSESECKTPEAGSTVLFTQEKNQHRVLPYVPDGPTCRRVLKVVSSGVCLTLT